MFLAPTTSAFALNPHRTHSNSLCDFRFFLSTWPQERQVLEVSLGSTITIFTPACSALYVMNWRI